MGYGSNVAVTIAEDDYREDCAEIISHRAAALVGAGDMGRTAAISALAEWLRNENDAGGDLSGVLSVENVFPSPSRVVPPAQVIAIAAELMDAARDAADSL